LDEVLDFIDDFEEWEDDKPDWDSYKRQYHKDYKHWKEDAPTYPLYTDYESEGDL
jgi:hypothetical protein